MNDLDESSRAASDRPWWQFSLWKLILATTAIAAIVGSCVSHAKERQLVYEIALLESYQRRLHNNERLLPINPRNIQWYVNLPLGESYQLCAKIHDPPIEVGVDLSTLTSDQSVPIAPGKHKIKVHISRTTSDTLINSYIDRKFVALSFQPHIDWLPEQIDSFYAPIPVSEQKVITLPLELGDMISVERSIDDEGKEVSVRKSHMRVWIEKVQP